MPTSIGFQQLDIHDLRELRVSAKEELEVPLWEFLHQANLQKFKTFSQTHFV